MACTLSQDTDIAATVKTPDGTTRVQELRCRADATFKFDSLRAGGLETCRLAATADFGEISCAANEPILIIERQLCSCTFAKATRFGPLTLPAGTSVGYYDSRPFHFQLPDQGAPVEGFGLALPPGAEGYLCDGSDAPKHLEVSRSAYVTIRGVKLTGFIAFDCNADGAFESGTLFEDAVVAGKSRQRGAIIQSDDLAPK